MPPPEARTRNVRPAQDVCNPQSVWHSAEPVGNVNGLTTKVGMLAWSFCTLTFARLQTSACICTTVCGVAPSLSCSRMLGCSSFKEWLGTCVPRSGGGARLCRLASAGEGWRALGSDGEGRSAWRDSDIRALALHCSPVHDESGCANFEAGSSEERGVHPDSPTCSTTSLLC